MFQVKVGYHSTQKLPRIPKKLQLYEGSGQVKETLDGTLVSQAQPLSIPCAFSPGVHYKEIEKGLGTRDYWRTRFNLTRRQEESPVIPDRKESVLLLCYTYLSKFKIIESSIVNDTM